MKISVVVPTHNRAHFAAHTIKSLVRQTLAATEIIVVDNASTDDTAAVIGGLKGAVKRLRYITEPRLGVSHARNRGAAEATGDLVAFIDDDAVASPLWLEALVDAALSRPDAAAVAGPIALRWTLPAPAWVRGLEGWYGQFDLGEARCIIEPPAYPFASNLALRREALLSIGGFPAELGPRGRLRIANEEDGLFRRVAERGWPVVFEPAALVHHWVHAERLSRRYLLGRGVTQGKSDVLVDLLFAPSRTRLQRARRSAAAAKDTLRAARVVVREQSPGGTMRAGIAASMSIGRSTREAQLAANMRPFAVPTPLAEQGASGLTAGQLEAFDRDGFVRIQRAFDGSALMEDRMWTFFARRGAKRHDPSTWPNGEARHLQKLLGDAVFMPIGGRGTTAAIDDLLGAGRWERPRHWGEFLVTFPDRARRWTVPTLWHTDAAYDDPLDPPLGVIVLSYINRVEHHGGGTLVVAGSHRLVAQFVARQSAIGEKSAVTRKAFYQSHPWLHELITPNDVLGRSARLSAGATIDGVHVRVIELTAEPGDIVIAHPLIAHCISPNCAEQPRFMRIIRPRLRQPAQPSGVPN